ncbi:DUF1634 domain-containing protein [Bacteroides reticulotermitis]|uniref:DUF1634 domain-containing protein n=2 Tax=Bacteroides reticulotermitis TaxID=1133319 RepID=W4UR32_9BACE|nr:DUF1634 domain-containing protein [Bacteroides reticulotermitis]MBB4042906.1 putative membrane protein [Bacteroides reticulotermitis]GAE83083.1 hypothetical protein JCM10512_1336 [Bacteroides reticulotermitis JCM 10512]HJD75079.1 DUF1634 domain-containing protein [Bacteroides reticulotermitis]
MKHLFSRTYWEQRDVEQYIGKLLRYGVILSSLITVFGGVIYLLQHHSKTADYTPTPSGQPFPGVDQYLRELNTILSGVLSFDGAAIIQLGVLVLIATPIIRVAFSAFSFLIEKDYLYVCITLIVLAIILANMILGLH